MQPQDYESVDVACIFPETLYTKSWLSRYLKCIHGSRTLEGRSRSKPSLVTMALPALILLQLIPEGEASCTTSHWCSNRGSVAHDFVLVVFDEAFTDVTHFPYIETPLKDKVEPGVVGYPSDKTEEQTGERGGKMQGSMDTYFPCFPASLISCLELYTFETTQSGAFFYSFPETWSSRKSWFSFLQLRAFRSYKIRYHRAERYCAIA